MVIDMNFVCPSLLGFEFYGETTEFLNNNVQILP